MLYIILGVMTIATLLYLKCGETIIIDKFRYLKDDGWVREEYWLIARRYDKPLRIKVNYETYQRTNKGDRLWLFNRLAFHK